MTYDDLTRAQVLYLLNLKYDVNPKFFDSRSDAYLRDWWSVGPGLSELDRDALEALDRAADPRLHLSDEQLKKAAKRALSSQEAVEAIVKSLC